MNRMHPEDLRAELAMRFYEINASVPDGASRESVIYWSVESADTLLAHLAKTAKPEAETRATSLAPGQKVRILPGHPYRDITDDGWVVGKAPSDHRGSVLVMTRFRAGYEHPLAFRPDELEPVEEAKSGGPTPVEIVDAYAEEACREWKARAEKAEAKVKELEAEITEAKAQERERCVQRILDGDVFFLAGIQPEMREAVVRRALEPK